MEWRNELGQLHRTDGPALVWEDGSHMWLLHGKLHRDNGPAVTHANGRQSWYCKGYLHRTDGPAVENADGTCQWWLNGVQVDEFTVWLLANTKETV